MRQNLPPVTLNLIIINLLIYLVGAILPEFNNNTLMRYLGLHFFEASDFNAAQPVTYMFMHGGFMHVFFNMFTLFMFGPILERVWGARRYFIYYMVCGIGAGLVQEAVWGMTWQHEYISAIAPINGLTFNSMEQVVNQALANNDPGFLSAVAQYKNSLITVGASGAIYGLLLGFAFVFPNMPMYFMFIPVPVKAKWMVLAFFLIELGLGIGGGGTIAHFAHLGGMLFGLIFLLIWKRNGTLGNNYF